jgi:outer membrane protein
LINLKKILIFILIFYYLPVLSQETLSLEECVNFALKNNIKIAQSNLGIQQSKFDMNQRKAAFLPSLNGFATHGYSFGNSLDYTSYEYVKEQTSSEYYGLSSDLTLFNGFRLRNNYRSGKYAYLSSQELYKDVTDQISMNIALDYLQIIMNKEQIKNTEDQLLYTQNLLDKTKLMVQVGEQTLSKEMELKAQLANDEMTLVEAKNQLLQSYLTLKQVMNWDLSKPLEIKDFNIDSIDFSTYQNLNITEIVEQFYANLPAVKKAKADYQSSRYSYLSSKGSYYPNFVLQSAVNSRYSSSAITDPINKTKVPFTDQLNNNFGQQISFSLNIPIFNNLRTSYSVQASKLNFKNNELALKETEQKAKNTIYEAYYLMNNAYRKFVAAENSLNAQKILFDQTNSMYVEGVLSFYDWQSAKNSFNRAQNADLSSKFEYFYRIKVFDYYRGIPIKLDK